MLLAPSPPTTRSAPANGASDCDLRLELQLDAGGGGLLLEHAQQRVTAHAAEAVSGRAEHLAAVVHVDVVPVDEVFRDAAVGVRIGVGNTGHRGVGEHDAEPERVVGAVTLDDPDAGGRGSAFFMSSAKYSEPGPPPMQTMSSGRSRLALPSFSSDAPMMRRCTSVAPS